MKSFSQYVGEGRAPRGAFDPRDRTPVTTKNVGTDKMVDMEDPAYNHSFNRAVPDGEKWPPKPKEKYKAAKLRWAVSDGKKSEHLANQA